MAIYSQAIHFSFFVLDDGFHIYENDYIDLTISNFIWFWTNSKTPVAFNFWQVIGSLGGTDNPELFRISNFILHSLNATLVYFIVEIFEKKIKRASLIALITSSIFFLHPIQIESVVWVSSLRGLLSSFFVLSAILISLKLKTSLKKTAALLLLFIFALLTKPVVFLLPFIFIFIDKFYHQSKTKEVIKENSPFILCLISGVILFSSDFLINMEGGDSFSRVKLMFFNFEFYLKRLFFIAPFGYEMSGLQEVYDYTFSLLDYVILSFGISIFPLSYLFLKKKTDSCRIAFIIFIVFYLPVSGLLSFHYQIVSVVAERYYYLPIIGIGWIISQIICVYMKRISKFILAVITFVLLMTTFRQVGKWDSFSVFNTKSPGKSFFYNILLGQNQLKNGDLDKAEASFKRAKSINSSFIGSNVGLMSVYAKKGDYRKVEELKDSLGGMIFEDWSLLSRYISVLVEKRDFNKAKDFMEDHLSRYIYSYKYVRIYINLLESEKNYIEQYSKLDLRLSTNQLELLNSKLEYIHKKITELESLQ